MSQECECGRENSWGGNLRLEVSLPAGGKQVKFWELIEFENKQTKEKRRMKKQSDLWTNEVKEQTDIQRERKYKEMCQEGRGFKMTMSF